MKIIVLFFALVSVQYVKAQDFEPYIDSNFVKEKIEEDVNYYHKSELYLDGSPVFLGMDDYQKNGVLFSSSRFDIETRTWTEHTFYDNGVVSNIKVCHDTLHCISTGFYPNGQVQYIYQYGKNGEYDGWQFWYSEEGKLEGKEFWIMGELIEEW